MKKLLLLLVPLIFLMSCTDSTSEAPQNDIVVGIISECEVWNGNQVLAVRGRNECASVITMFRKVSEYTKFTIRTSDGGTYVVELDTDYLDADSVKLGDSWPPSN